MASKLLCVFALILAAVAGQRPARIGPDGKPLLNRPVQEECKKRISHLEWNGHNYFLSWREPWHKFEDWDWFNGRNFCRDRCMDLVSFDTPGEYDIFAALMAKDNVSSIYTSGRKCNFKGKGCNAEHLQPINVNGWFWAGAKNTRIPATNQFADNTFWSPVGEGSLAQPDNYEGLDEGPLDTEFDIGVTIEGLQEFHDEACLAVQNNRYRDGISWHDVACHFRSVIVCEDSDQLMDLVESQNGESVKDTVVKNERAVDLENLDQSSLKPWVRNPRNAPRPVVGRPGPRRPGQFGPPGFGLPGPARPRPQRQNNPRPRPQQAGGSSSGFLSNLFSAFGKK